MEIEKIVPKDGPSIEEVKKYIDKYKNELIVIKYGGNVFIDRNIFNNFISDISILNKLGLSIIIVHGGGPRIKRELEKSNIHSKFIRGLRVTDKNIINIVESVLIDFNNDIVDSLKKKGCEAISIHTKSKNIIEVIPEISNLGFVGIPSNINIHARACAPFVRVRVALRATAYVFGSWGAVTRGVACVAARIYPDKHIRNNNSMRETDPCVCVR